MLGSRKQTNHLFFNKHFYRFCNHSFFSFDTGSRPTAHFKGCLSPLSMGSRYITPASLPDGVTYTNNGAVYGCHSDNQCQSAAAGRRVCPQNAECVDLWNEFECVCVDGKCRTGEINPNLLINRRDCLNQVYTFIQYPVNFKSDI